jgi:hypothetical protein
LATLILTCKGRRGHKHFEGDLLAFFAKQKFKGCIYPLDACVFSYASVYMKRKVDWRTMFTRNKEDIMEYAKADVPDNFSFFRQNVGVDLHLMHVEPIETL